MRVADPGTTAGRGRRGSLPRMLELDVTSWNVHGLAARGPVRIAAELAARTLDIHSPERAMAATVDPDGRRFTAVSSAAPTATPLRPLPSQEGPRLATCDRYIGQSPRYVIILQGGSSVRRFDEHAACTRRVGPAGSGPPASARVPHRFPCSTKCRWVAALPRCPSQVGRTRETLHKLWLSRDHYATCAALELPARASFSAPLRGVRPATRTSTRRSSMLRARRGRQPVRSLHWAVSCRGRCPRDSASDGPAQRWLWLRRGSSSPPEFQGSLLHCPPA